MFASFLKITSFNSPPTLEEAFFLEILDINAYWQFNPHKYLISPTVSPVYETFRS